MVRVEVFTVEMLAKLTRNVQFHRPLTIVIILAACILGE